MKTFIILGLSVSALVTSEATAYAAGKLEGRLHDRRTSETVGEIRQRGERHYDVYDHRGERKAYGIERGKVIEFYDAKTSRRLPIEIRQDR
jgi:hypothetical protein